MKRVCPHHIGLTHWIYIPSRVSRICWICGQWQRKNENGKYRDNP